MRMMQVRIDDRSIPMNIAYYMPFKPMGHRNPSGDLVTGTELFNHLAQNNRISLASRLRCRWIYYHPSLWLRFLLEKKRILRKCRTSPPDIWFSYHSYYKAPDLLGYHCSRKLNIPYVIFQGIYSTKRRKKLKTLPGFILNRKILLATDHIFTNKKKDLKNLRRLLPEERLSYIAPGIHPEEFTRCEHSGTELRAGLNCLKKTVIFTAAMFRPGVKTEGIIKVIHSCAELAKDNPDLVLWIAGDGDKRLTLEKTAGELLPGKVRFLGKINRNEMYRVYSGADIFAFPGIHESLGMVYLEAQSCRLPVVALADWGGGEAVIHNRTGLLSPAARNAEFTRNMRKLFDDPDLRKRLGREAEIHIRSRHNLAENYTLLEKKLRTIAQDHGLNNHSRKI
jgi:glycosyltransferase involved in cell wall biosynthesis